MAVRQAKHQDKLYKLPDGTGLYLLVNKSGKYWRYDYRFAGKRKIYCFGVYPVVSLSVARDARLEAQHILAGGTGPMDAKKAEQLRIGAKTFLDVAKQWQIGKTEKHAADAWRRLEIDVLPDLGGVPIRELSVSKVRKILQAIEKCGAFDMARRQLQKCNQIMRFILAHDLVEANHVAGYFLWE